MTQSLPPQDEPLARVSDTDSNLQPVAPQSESRVPIAVLTGFAVAILGGCVWAALVIFAKLELGILAWGIGIAIGASMVAVARKGSTQLGLAALLLALLGLSIGKGLVYQFQLVPLYHSEFEDPVEAQEALATLEFRERFDLNGFDLLWVFLALASAWQMGAGRRGG